MSEKANTNLLAKALHAKLVERGILKADHTAPAEDDGGDSYTMTCPACKAAIQFGDSDLEQWRTDDAAGETGDSDSDEDGDDDSDSDSDDDDDSDEDDEERELDASSKSKLVAKIVGRKL